MLSRKFKFIDLCAGIGGFHLALEQFGGECVFAAEIDDFALSVYEKNFNMDAHNDITILEPSSIPEYDVLCAGFPCQTFSKAGGQMGFEDTRGTLFFNIANIVKETMPKFILLENVRNLASHDKGRTWLIIRKTLINLGYTVPEKPFILSPLEFGIPQSRERVFIPCARNDIKESPFELIIPNRVATSVFTILDSDVPSSYDITSYQEKVLEVWEEFIKGVHEKVIGFPVWFDYLNDATHDISEFPEWKKNFVNKNRQLYLNNKEFINSWKKKHDYLKEFIPTDRKFEWQMGSKYSSIFEGIIQFRPSGVRVKKPDFLPALVAMVHIPIVGKYKRKITPRECARLQSFPEEFIICNNEKQAYKQFGNAVNVDVVKYVFENTIFKYV